MQIFQRQCRVGSTIIICALCVSLFAQSTPDDSSRYRAFELGKEGTKITYLAESAYWPDLDLKDVKDYVTSPDPKEKEKFTKLVRQTINEGFLPKDLAGGISFLRGWRGQDSKNFVMQYIKDQYLIRVKNQVIEDGRWKSFWLTVVLESKNRELIVNKGDINAIFSITDRFLLKKVNSSAQNYSGITNMNTPGFEQMDDGYFVSYAVASSRPDVDGVTIWTDGYRIIINLQERRKAIYPPS